MTQITKTKR